MWDQPIVTAATEVLTASGIRAAQPFLNALPFPVMIIAPDYRIEWMNQAAETTYQAVAGGPCHLISHGHQRPCDQHGEPCPKLQALTTRQPADVYHAHGTHQGSELFRVTALPAENARIVELHIPLSELVTRDTVTGLYSRQFFVQLVSRQLALLKRMGSAYSVMVVDLDRFKEINDTHGHPVGDEILRSVGRALRTTIRTADTAGRWGGEELCVFLPDCDIRGAERQAGRIQEALKAVHIDVGSHMVGVTASFGLAASTGSYDFGHVFHRADEAMYQAKEAGRDRIVIAS